MQNNDQKEGSSEDTSWGGVAAWYDKLLREDPDSYQTAVILPNLMRLVAPRKGLAVLDLACGQGFFSRAFHAGGASVVGVDLGKQLIDLAKKQSSPDIAYHVSSADSIGFLKDASFDLVNITLAIQNIEKYQATFAECGRVLKPQGKLVMVLNHPTFRIPQASSWDFDEKKSVQYRRIDSYLGESKASIDMEPGKKAQASAATTISFHRPLQAYMKALEKAGFAITRLEEWTSHRKSEKGPRQIAEDRARREIPLFLMLECTLIRK